MVASASRHLGDPAHGLVRYSMREYDKALADLNRAIELQPRLSDLLARLRTEIPRT